MYLGTITKDTNDAAPCKGTWSTRGLQSVLAWPWGSSIQYATVAAPSHPLFIIYDTVSTVHSCVGRPIGRQLLLLGSSCSGDPRRPR